MRRLGYSLPMVLALTGAVAGCGGTAKPIPVEGVVLLDEQPLGSATVTFTPVGTQGQPASGQTDASGVFKLTSGDGRIGAVPGQYKVTVSRTEARTRVGEAVQKTPEEIDKMMRQGRGKNRGGGPPKKQTSDIPARYNGPDTPLQQKVPPDGKVVFKLEST
jgi:hypothetical protein